MNRFTDALCDPIILQWEVEKLENGNYKFKASRNIVGDIDGHLFALLFDDHIASATTTEWTLTQDERDTAGNAYVCVLRCRNPLY